MDYIIGAIMLLSLFIVFEFTSVVYTRAIYNKIRKTGIEGFGRLMSCKRVYFNFRYSAIIPEYVPIVEFYYAEKRYEMPAVGRFGVSPGKVGDEIAIIFSEEYTDKIIIVRDKSTQDNYNIYVCLCHLVIIFIIFLIEMLLN
ncbi:MAG: hypothetical protein FWE24_06465 [Defluviitaleaceae bacterium]|nr:hypothetical protein [Defluviitaleaceae bacterium]